MARIVCCQEHEALLVGSSVDAKLTNSEVVELMRAQGNVNAVRWIDRDHIRASEQVGVIVAPNVRLEILPKIDGFGSTAARRTLIRMLAQVWDLPIREGELASMASQKQNLLEIFIHLFARRLAEQVRGGLSRCYEQHRDDVSRVRGKLDLIRQYSRNAAYPHRLSCVFDELTANTPVNRLLLSAIDMLRRRTAIPVTERLLKEIGFHFEDVACVPPEVALRERVVLTPSQKRWEPIVKLARLLLSGVFQSTHLGRSEGFALLFDMNVLFERFVATLVSKVARARGFSMTTQGPGRDLVQDEDGQRLLQMRPDIYVRTGQEIVVLDTKWKQLEPKAGFGIGASDLYQVHAYHRAYRARATVLIFPQTHALPENRTPLSWTFVESSASLRVLAINLEAPSQFMERIAELLQAVADEEQPGAAHV